MSWGVRTQRDASTLCTGQFTLDTSFSDVSGPRAQARTASIFGATASVTMVLFHVSSSPEPGTSDADMVAAYTTWLASFSLPSGFAIEQAAIAYWQTEASVPLASQVSYVCSGIIVGQRPNPTPPYFPPMLPPETIFAGPTSITADFALSASNLHWRTLITDNPVGDYASIMHPTQRSAEHRIYGDATSTVTATCGACSETGNLGFAEETWVPSLFPTVGISNLLEPAVGNGYGDLTLNDANGNPVNWEPVAGVHHYQCKTLAHSAWHEVADDSFDPDIPVDGLPSNANTTFRLVTPGAGVLSLQRRAGGTSGLVGWGGNVQAWSIDLDLRMAGAQQQASVGASDFGAGDTSAGNAFDAAIYRKWTGVGVRQSEADVSLAPGIYSYRWQVISGLPESLWGDHPTRNPMAVYVRAAWLAANGRDVVATNWETMENGVGFNLKVPLAVVPPSAADWTSGAWFGGVITTWREQANLDKPDGENRPSEWEGMDGATIVA